MNTNGTFRGLMFYKLIFFICGITGREAVVLILQTDCDAADRIKSERKTMENSIIHLNVADFAVAVEQNRQPDLKGHPLIISPEGAPRAVVYDMSEEAYKEVIRQGMPLARAKRISRRAKVIPPSFNRYELAMQDMLKRALAYSPLIESGMSDGHLFLDVTGSSRLFGPPVDIAWRLNKEMKKDFRLDPIWSVATNKLIAKVATRVVKPIGEYIVGAGEETAFLSPLHLNLLPGLDKKDLVLFREFNFLYISQAMTLTIDQLKVPFRQKALFIYETIRGIDRSAIKDARYNKKKLAADHEFADDTNDAALLKKGLYLLVEQICKKLRSKQKHGAAMEIILSYSDGLQSRAVKKITPSTANDMAMFKHLVPLLYKAWTRRTRIRHMRMICHKLCAPETQMEIFSTKPKAQKQNSLVTTMDKIRARFGPKAIKAGLALAS